MKPRVHIILGRLAIMTMFMAFAGPIARAEDPQTLFSLANEAYREGRYAEATVHYEQILVSGHASAGVYYNLGNAYYKSNAIPDAILNYERALRLKPGDPDIEFNLKMANQQTVDKIEPLPEVFYKKWFSTLVHKLTSDDYAWRAILLLWIALALGVAYLFVNQVWVKKISFLSGLFIFFLAMLLLIFSGRKAREMERAGEAIVFATNMYVKSSPDDKSTNLFMLHAGTKIQVVDELEGWKLIRIANGNQGWAKSDALEII